VQTGYDNSILLHILKRQRERGEGREGGRERQVSKSNHLHIHN